MIGESLKSISDFMMDPDIVRICDKYVSSVFSIKQNFDKKLFLLEEIQKEKSTEVIAKYKELLRRIKVAEELQFLGKMLKINQGLPTNTTDLYSYIKSIEKYIESVINPELYNEYLSRNAEIEFEKSKWLTPELQKKIDSKEVKLIDIASKEYMSLLKARKNFINETLIPNWKRFDLIRFIKDNDYAVKEIASYNNYKRIFNILDVINSVPHFSRMFSTIALNKDILNALSVRNAIEDNILNAIDHNFDTSPNPIKKLSSKEVGNIKSTINKMLINKWIISKDLVIPDVSIRSEKPVMISINSDDKINTLREYIENHAIPVLRRNLPNNTFVQSLTLGIKYDNASKTKKSFWKLPFNMTQIDSNPTTLKAYEECLRSFNDLKYAKLRDISINPVDLFYLYNLIVNDDKFGPNSLTRIFEDIIATTDSENLLLYDYNNWIDKQDIQELFIEFLDKLTNTQDNNIEGTEIVKKDVEISNSYYSVKQATDSKVIALMKTSNIPGLHIVYDSDLINEDAVTRTAKGFIKDGEIYINVDRADNSTVIHEFGHLYLADVKSKHPDKYYPILSEVRKTDIWKQMRSLDEYKNKVGSDFDEEVLATLISNGTNNEVEANIVSQIMDLVSPEFKLFITQEILPQLDETFFSTYKVNQKVATIKNKLFKQETIKENCE